MLSQPPPVPPPSCDPPSPFPPTMSLSQRPHYPPTQRPLPRTHPLLNLLPQTLHPPPKRPTPFPLAPLGVYQSDPAQTRPMPVVLKHEQVKAKTLQGATAAMAIAKHGSPIMLPPAHGVGNPCTPHVHSLRCPHLYAHNVMLSLLTSLIYNQYEACPLQ